MLARPPTVRQRQGSKAWAAPLRESGDHEHMVGDWHTELKELGEDFNFTPEERQALINAALPMTGFKPGEPVDRELERATNEEIERHRPHLFVPSRPRGRTARPLQDRPARQVLRIQPPSSRSARRSCAPMRTSRGRLVSDSRAGILRCFVRLPGGRGERHQ